MSSAHLIRVARGADLDVLVTLDRIPPGDLAAIVARGHVLLATGADDRTPVGWLRWGLFWDEVPFMNRLHLVEEHRGLGLGRHLVETWEANCARAGHTRVLTSTMSDERAQHFFRHLGYVDTGTLLLPGEAAELILRKDLSR